MNPFRGASVLIFVASVALTSLQGFSAAELLRQNPCTEPGYEACKDGIQCVSLLSFCNGEVDCDDGSDEDTTVCAALECTQPGFVSCPKAPGQPNQCISEDGLCDGSVQCTSGSDEDLEFCKEHTCMEGLIKCMEGNTCVYGGFCDGTNDCNDEASTFSSDEDPAVCSTFQCPEGYKKCGDSSICVEACESPVEGGMKLESRKLLSV